MATQQKNNRSYSKLAQIYNSFQDDYPKAQLVKNALKKEGDINFKIPSNSCIDSATKLNLKGCTALHLAVLKNDPEIAGILLNNGADFTSQNHEGRTALHYAFGHPISSKNSVNELVDVILSTHLSLVDPSNPCDSDGLSHFHIACWHNRLDAVEFFLKSGIPVNKSVNFNAKRFAGFTPLHFAAAGMALSTISELLQHNANIDLKDAKGLTPSHIFLEEKIRMFEFYSANVDRMSKDMISAFDEIMNKLLCNNNDVDEIGLTEFHIACTQRDPCMVEYFLEQNVDIDQQVNMNSPIRPGYTALHFAVHCNLDTVKMLLKKKANFMVKDAKGVTPMDLIWDKCRCEELTTIIMQNWKYVTFSDKQTRLLDFIEATGDLEMLNSYLLKVHDINTRIGEVPACWTSRTLLHFAVMLKKCREIIGVCLRRRLGSLGSLVDVQDAYGSTPIHLAFRTNKLDVVKILLEYSEAFDNDTDKDGLSYLHIGCALNNYDFVSKAIRDSNIKRAYNGTSSHGLITPGSTALHVAISKGHDEIINILLHHGLDLGAKDANGKSPIHRLFGRAKNSETTCRKLLTNEALTNHMLEEVGLTRLHMAIYCKESNVQKYITPSNIEATINCQDPSSHLFPYDGCTPLHMAIKSGAKDEIVESLLNQGAHLLVMNARGDTPLYSALSRSSDYIAMNDIVMKLQYNQVLRRQMEEMSGITMLHIVCYTMNVVTISWLLVGRVDVNAKVKLDCPVWTGCTPLHVLLMNIEQRRNVDDICQILKLLLAAGADVAAVDANGETPIHLSLREFSTQRVDRIVMPLLKNLRDFKVNPVDRSGMSHLHAACLLNNDEAVKSFLDNGADADRPIDFFAKNFAGETPLHLAVDHRTEKIFNSEAKRKTILLLLNFGADVKAEDSLGQTAFHKAMNLRGHLDILENFVSHGAPMDTQNIFQQTPLEWLLQSENVSAEKIKFFEKCGCRLNISNPLNEEGYISMLISQNYHPHYKVIQRQVKLAMISATEVATKCFEVMVDAIDASLPDDQGRNLIHNLVTTNDPYVEIFSYDDLIKRFQAAGVDIDLQDKKGRTALHLAAQFGNLSAVIDLLNNGADVNILDAMNKPAIHYAIEYYYNEKFCPARNCHKQVVEHLVNHVTRVQKFELTINDKNIVWKARGMHDILLLPPFYVYNFKESGVDLVFPISRTLIVDDQPKLTVADFLSETGKGLTSYPFMLDERRRRVDVFFRDYFHGFRDICALQYRKAVKRIPLVKSGIKSVWKMAGEAVPLVCIEMIFQHLANCDLAKLVEAYPDN